MKAAPIIALVSLLAMTTMQAHAGGWRPVRTGARGTDTSHIIITKTHRPVVLTFKKKVATTKLQRGGTSAKPASAAYYKQRAVKAARASETTGSIAAFIGASYIGFASIGSSGHATLDAIVTIATVVSVLVFARASYFLRGKSDAYLTKQVGAELKASEQSE